MKKSKDSIEKTIDKSPEKDKFSFTLKKTGKTFKRVWMNKEKTKEKIKN